MIAKAAVTSALILTAGALAACATGTGERVSSASTTFDVFCGSRAGDRSCHDEARARCAAGERAVVTDYPSAKNRRDLRVVCERG